MTRRLAGLANLKPDYTATKQVHVRKPGRARFDLDKDGKLIGPRKIGANKDVD